MTAVQIDKITISGRQRHSITEKGLEELALSIQSKGLLHPIVVRLVDTTILLVAGERRLKAMTLLHSRGVKFSHNNQPVVEGFVPATSLAELTTTQYYEAELEENLLREDLSWQDEVQAMDELHRLRLAQNPKQKFADTGRELVKLSGKESDKKTGVIAAAKTSRAMLIADFLDDPDVVKASTEQEAFNIASRKLEETFSSELVSRVKTTTRHTFIQGDAVTVLKDLKEKYSCFIVDPPYGINANTFGDAAKLTHSYIDSPEEALKLCKQLLDAFYNNLSTPDAHLYMFCDVDHFVTLKEQAASIGWKVKRTPLVWLKGSAGHVPDVKISFRRSYEIILFASKGNRRFSEIISDSLKYSLPQQREHAAQKPVELYQKFMELSCEAGESVLDPCCGSGTIFLAAAQTGCRGTGVDLSKQPAELNCIKANEMYSKDK